MESGIVSAVVTVLGLLFTYFGITVDPVILDSLVGGIVAVITAVAAIYSVISHSQKNTAAQL